MRGYIMNIQTLFKSIVLGFFLTGCGSSCNPETKESDTNVNEPDLVTWEECGYLEGDHMCNFTLLNHDGEEFELYDHIGSPIVIDFSTMWCGYCQVAAGTIPSISDQYADNDLKFITVLIDDASGMPVDPEDLQLWVDTFELDDHYLINLEFQFDSQNFLLSRLMMIYYVILLKLLRNLNLLTLE